MACNSCFKAFSIFRQEKGCPNCGFSYCSKCLNYKTFVKKFKEERKVCLKCSRLTSKSNKGHVIPPDSCNRQNVLSKDNSSTSKLNDNMESNRIDYEIQERLKKLKEGASLNIGVSNNMDIAERLERLKEDTVSSIDSTLYPRMAKAAGSSVTALVAKPERSEQEEVNDLLVELEEKTKIETKYNNDFENKLSEIEMRLQKLRSANPRTALDVQGLKSNEDNNLMTPSQILEQPIRTEQKELNDLLKELEEESKTEAKYNNSFIMKLSDLEIRLNNLKKSQTSTDLDVQKHKSISPDEQTVLREIFGKLQTDTTSKDIDEMSADLNDELQFCEICNEDAKVRCKQCKYLFCIRCFNEHKDEDCNEYEIYNPPK